MSYWANKGKYEKEYKLMWEKYVPHQGLNLTDSQSANSALLSLIRASHKYYRVFNDGDAWVAAGIRSLHGMYGFGHLSDEDYKSADAVMEKFILRAWKATKHATLPCVGFNEDPYGILNEVQKKEVRDDWLKRKMMTPEEYSNWCRHKNWSGANMRYLSEQIAQYKKAIADNNKTYDLIYMKEELPVMIDELKQKLRKFNKTGKVDFAPYGFDKEKQEAEIEEVISRSKKLAK